MALNLDQRWLAEEPVGNHIKGHLGSLGESGRTFDERHAAQNLFGALDSLLGRLDLLLRRGDADVTFLRFMA
jgi:hypothetical protein